MEILTTNSKIVSNYKIIQCDSLIETKKNCFLVVHFLMI